MKKTELLIIGAGLAGLFAACLAARRGRKVQVLSYGASAITLGSGIIDCLGYSEIGEVVKNPWQELHFISSSHPYGKIGPEMVRGAWKEFLQITKEMQYPYFGNLERNYWLPTVLGTFKPTNLLPYTMQVDAIDKNDDILLVEFDLLKDFSTTLALRNFQRNLPGKNWHTCTIKLPFDKLPAYRDINVLDIARWLETEEGRNNFLEQLRSHVRKNMVIFLPPVLGLEPDYNILTFLQRRLKCPFIELSALNPAVTGMRLDKLLRRYAQHLGVEIVNKAKVIGADVVGGLCRAVRTSNYAQERTFAGNEILLATGGIYGKGLVAGPASLKEPIFGIDIPVGADQLAWSKEALLTERQPFALYGIKTDDNLRPLRENGELVASNLRVIGRGLAGYDFCFEKSGNGVALSTAYAALANLWGGE